MGPSSLLVLSLALVLVIVSSAPFGKAPEVVEIAKRDQEMILFGNQQNNPRVKKKKSDPAMSVVADNNNVDKEGLIEAAEAPEEAETEVIPSTVEQATDVSEQLEEPVVAELEEPSQAGESEQTSEEQDGESVEAELPPIKQQMPEEAEAQVEDNVEEELNDIMADSQAPAAEETPGQEETEIEVPEETETELAEEPKDEEISEATEMVPAEPEEDSRLKDLYYYIMENEKEAPQNTDDYYYDLGYYPYRRRRSSRPTRAVTEGGMVHNSLQRAKRIKRDLFDDEDEEYYIPYVEEEYEPELSEEDLYGLYNTKPKYDDDVETLLNMYQEAPSSLTYNPYEAYEVEDVYPEVYQEEEAQEPQYEPQYVPSKRQMMSSLPGIKKRYFYPFSREPETHWGAFVPQQKRDYDEAYGRLLALASALAEDSPYYEAYRKK